MRRDRGSVTAELAAALPVLVLLLVAALTGIGAMITKLRCVDAAREVALAAGRGEAEPPSGAAPIGSAAVPGGATVEVRTEGDLVHVVVRASVRPLGRRLPGFAVAGEAVAVLEPGS